MVKKELTNILKRNNREIGFWRWNVLLLTFRLSPPTPYSWLDFKFFNVILALFILHPCLHQQFNSKRCYNPDGRALSCGSMLDLIQRLWILTVWWAANEPNHEKILLFFSPVRSLEYVQHCLLLLSTYLKTMISYSVLSSTCKKNAYFTDSIASLNFRVCKIVLTCI